MFGISGYMYGDGEEIGLLSATQKHTPTAATEATSGSHLRVMLLLFGKPHVRPIIPWALGQGEQDQSGQCLTLVKLPLISFT